MTSQRSLFRTVLVGVGLLGVGVATTMALAPQMFPDGSLAVLVEAAESVDSERAVTVTAIVVGLCAIAYFRGTSSTADDLEAFVDTPPEESARPVDVNGTAIDTRLRETLWEIERGWAADSETDLEDEIREATIEAIQFATGCSKAAAATRVAAGDWTDDRIAAAFLGGEAAPDYPLFVRVQRWLRPEQVYERAVDRTMAEIDRLVDQAAGIGGRR